MTTLAGACHPEAHAMAENRSVLARRNEEDQNRRMTTRMEITFRLDVAVKEDLTAGCFVAWCPTVGIYSAGNSHSEAQYAIKSALVMFIKHCYKRKILDDVLVMRGFQPDMKDFGGHGEIADGTNQFIQVQLREFGGQLISMDIQMPLSSMKDFECQA
jgi:predicted RNase H-like HicB family nuclease